LNTGSCGRAANSKCKNHLERRIPSMISKELLDSLVCPVCMKPLMQKQTETGESLKCSECHRVYPVRDNILILLVDQAVKES